MRSLPVIQLLAFSCAAALMAPPRLSAQTVWHLIWNDEFNGPVDSLPDSLKWADDLGNNAGWGNHELESYTSLPENAHMDGRGNLVIHVESGPSGYSSARLKTQGLFTVQYGRIEARIKLPSGQGIWPAFWMLGANITAIGWPQCGEIDIMENKGREPSSIHGTVHGPGYSGSNGITSAYTLPGGRTFADDFHTFAVQWSPSSITFYVDGVSYETVMAATIGETAQWVFNNPFFLLLNVAVGGDFAGQPNATTQFPQNMLVDYVRVYQQQTNVSAPVISPGGVVDAASFRNALAPGGLASLFGSGFASDTVSDLFDASAGSFVRSALNMQVLVNGVPGSLTYVSPSQINFQIPWDTVTGTPLNIEVERDGSLSNPITITTQPSAPTAFGVDGVAILTCLEGAARAGAHCTLWGNGFGVTKSPQLDGTPATLTPLSSTEDPCYITVGGEPAAVTFCGAAPGLIINQLNFIYPAGVMFIGPTIPAEILTGGNVGNVILPNPW